MYTTEFEQLISRYLNGKATFEEEQALLVELQGSPERKALFKQRSNAWMPEQDSDRDRKWARLSAQITPPAFVELPRRRSLSSWFVAAAAVLLLLIGGLTAYLYRTDSPTALEWETVVADGSDHSMELPDGSQLYLRANSTLRYVADFAHHRQVALTGEAFFDVKADPSHPFVVEAEALTLTVKGTSFSVKAHADSAAVVLVTGKVSLSCPNQVEEIELRPNQRAVYQRDRDELTLTEVDSEQLTIWRKGVIAYENATIETIIQLIEEAYQVHLVAGTPADPTQRFTGAFRQTQTLESVIEQTEKLTAIPLSLQHP